MGNSRVRFVHDPENFLKNKKIKLILEQQCYSPRMKQRRYELSKQKYLQDHEVARLEEILQRFATTSPRDTTLIWLSLHTGARASEILAITAQDLDYENRSVYIKGNKSSADRDMPLPLWLFKKLSQLPIDKETQRFFPISYIRFYQIWLMYRPVKKKLHSLRHTFALRVYSRTNSLRILKTALGHRSWKNTMIYMTYQHSVEELRLAIYG